MELCAPVPDSLTPNTILAGVNKAVTSTGTKHVFVRQTKAANLSLLTTLNTAASTMGPYFEFLSLALRSLGLQVATIAANS